MQAAASSVNSVPHADGQDPYSFVADMAAMPGSVLPQQEAMSQATPAGSPSTAGADKGTQSMSQQQDSAAVRVEVWGGAVVGSCVLWVVLMNAFCQ